MRLSVLAIALTLVGQGRNEKAVSICQLSFKAPAEWVATTDRSYPAAEEACTGSLKSPLYDKGLAAGEIEHNEILTIRLYRKSIDGLREDWELRRAGSRWFVGEDAFERPAYEIKGPGWWGLRVDSLPMRGYTKDGYAGQSQAVFLLLSSTTGTRTAVVIAGADDGPLQLFLNSVRFERSR